MLAPLAIAIGVVLTWHDDAVHAAGALPDAVTANLGSYAARDAKEAAYLAGADLDLSQLALVAEDQNSGTRFLAGMNQAGRPCAVLVIYSSTTDESAVASACSQVSKAMSDLQLVVGGQFGARGGFGVLGTAGSTIQAPAISAVTRGLTPAAVLVAGNPNPSIHEVVVVHPDGSKTTIPIPGFEP